MTETNRRRHQQTPGTGAAWISIVLLGLVCASGCVTSVHDGEVIANNPVSSIPIFGGYGVNPSEAVLVYAKTSQGEFEYLARTTTGTTSLSWARQEWYGWTFRNLNIPSRYWINKNGCGYKVTLKVKVGEHWAMTLKEPFLSCWGSRMGLYEFYEDCSSSNSPEITLETCGVGCC